MRCCQFFLQHTSNFANLAEHFVWRTKYNGFLLFLFIFFIHVWQCCRQFLYTYAQNELIFITLFLKPIKIIRFILVLRKLKKLGGVISSHVVWALSFIPDKKRVAQKNVIRGEKQRVSFLLFEPAADETKISSSCCRRSSVEKKSLIFLLEFRF